GLEVRLPELQVHDIGAGALQFLGLLGDLHGQERLDLPATLRGFYPDGVGHMTPGRHAFVPPLAGLVGREFENPGTRRPPPARPLEGSEVPRSRNVESARLCPDAPAGRTANGWPTSRSPRRATVNISRRDGVLRRGTHRAPRPFWGVAPRPGPFARTRRNARPG